MLFYLSFIWSRSSEKISWIGSFDIQCKCMIDRSTMGKNSGRTHVNLFVRLFPVASKKIIYFRRKDQWSNDKGRICYNDSGKRRKSTSFIRCDIHKRDNIIKRKIFRGKLTSSRYEQAVIQINRYLNLCLLDFIKITENPNHTQGLLTWCIFMPGFRWVARQNYL